MNKYSILLIAAFFFTNATFAQTRFEKGFFIDANDKQVNCLIKNERWLNSPKIILYKLSENSNEIEVDATKIKKFKVNDGPLYVAHTGSFPVYKNNTATQVLTMKINTIDRSAFLKPIITGTASLFEFREGNDISYAYTLNDNEMEILLYGESVGENNLVSKINTYKNQLFKDVKCGSKTDIQNLKYSTKSLKEYFYNYNVCIDSNFKNEEDQSTVTKKSKSSIKLWAGVQQNKFSSAIINSILQFEDKISPKVGIEFEHVLGFNNNKWALFINSSYNEYETLANYEPFSTNPTVAQATFEFSRLENFTGARHYMFFNDNSSIFIETGFTFDYDFKAELDNLIGNAAINTSSGDFKTIYFGLAAGVGYSFNQKFYTRLNIYSGQNILVFFTSKNNIYNRMAFTIGYKL